jgi:hypothetical protein
LDSDKESTDNSNFDSDADNGDDFDGRQCHLLPCDSPGRQTSQLDGGGLVNHDLEGDETHSDQDDDDDDSNPHDDNPACHDGDTQQQVKQAPLGQESFDETIADNEQSANDMEVAENQGVENEEEPVQTESDRFHAAEAQG